jgi:hypothetical protein
MSIHADTLFKDGDPLKTVTHPEYNPYAMPYSVGHPSDYPRSWYPQKGLSHPVMLCGEVVDRFDTLKEAQAAATGLNRRNHRIIRLCISQDQKGWVMV